MLLDRGFVESVSPGIVSIRPGGLADLCGQIGIFAGESNKEPVPVPIALIGACPFRETAREFSLVRSKMLFPGTARTGGGM